MNEKIIITILNSILNKKEKLDKNTMDWLTNDDNRHFYETIKIYLNQAPSYSEHIIGDIVDKVNRKIKISNHTIKTLTRKQTLKIAAISATSTAAIFLLSLFTYNYINTLTPQPQKLFSFVMPYNNKASVVLSDGTSVILKPGSKIDYNNFDEGKNREIILNGEAFFDVAKSDKKFIVKLNSSKIEVKGTKFNVKANSYDDFIETTLIEGHIVFMYKNAFNKIDSVDMRARDRVVFDKISHNYKISEISEPNEYVINDEYRFDNVPLSRVFEVISSIHNIKFVSTSTIDSLRYTGAIRRSHSMNDIMELISKTTKVRYKNIDSTTFFISK